MNRNHRGSLRQSTRRRKLALEALEARSLLATLPLGFDEVTVAAGLLNPTTMTFAPDGRLFVAERDGTLKIVTNAGLSPTPLGNIDQALDFGINGIVTDPNFATNGFLYVYYTRDVEPTPVNRLSRFQISATDPNQLDPTSETVLLDDISGGEAFFHNGGFLKFGLDGYLYLGVGDGLEEQLVQDLTSLHGKLLRLDPANYPNIIPATNPYVNDANARPEIWGLGFRNPFSGGVNPLTGDLYVNDVGSVFYEEINKVNAGGNFGWPLREGAVEEVPFVDPVFAYPHVPEIGGSVTGGAFYTGTEFPGEYVGDYFFGDYTLGFVKRFDPVTNQVEAFGTGLNTPVDVEASPDGQLYWLSIEAGTVRRFEYSLGNHAPEPAFDADPSSGLGPLTVRFNAAATEDQDGDPLTYAWDFGDGTTGSGIDVTHTYSTDGSYAVVLTASDGALSASTPPRTIVVGDTVPNVTISAPAIAATYRAGDTISFAGDAVDRNGVPLPDEAFEWSVVFHHRFHTHPFIPSMVGVRNGTFTIPPIGETDANQFYRVHVKVTNSSGLSSSRFVDVLPEVSPFTLTTNVVGLKLLLDSSPVTTPDTLVGVENMEREVEAPLTQQLGDVTYEFERWSDNAPRVRTLTTPQADAVTFTAIYQPLPQQATILAEPDPQWYLGEVRTYDVTITNETLTDWSATGVSAVKLAVYFGNETLESGAQSATLIDLPQDLAAGATLVLPITVTAPNNPGPVVLRHRMLAADGNFLRGSDADPLTISPFSAIYSVTPPTTWLTGTTRTYSITLTNSSAETWQTTGQTPTNLGVYFGDENDAPYVWSQEPQRFGLPYDVESGESVTFTIAVRAPATPGNYVLRHRLVKEQVTWYLPQLKTDVVVTDVDAVYSAAIPDVRTPGETLNYVVTLTNAYFETWNITAPQEVHLGVYFSGNSDAIYDWSSEPQRFNLPTALAPGESVDIPITIAAPTTPGSYTLRHRVVKEGVRWFNSLLKSTVNVGTFSATYAGTIPAEMTEATTRIIPVTVTNTGTVPWTSTSLEPLQLGYYFNAAGVTTPPSLASAVMLPLGTTIGVGESLTLDVPLVTPATAGEYRLEFRLARGNHAWLPTALGQNVSIGTRHASYVAAPPTDWWTAEQRLVTVSVTNSGTLPWKATGAGATRLGYYFVPTAAVELPAITAGTFIPLAADLLPGQTAVLSLPVSAPAVAGDYRLEFRLEHGGEWFADGSAATANVAALTAVYGGTVPTEWPTTALKTYALTLTNNSTRTWLATGTERVQLQASFSGQTPVLFALPNNVAPGTSVTINVTMTAPAIAGAGTLVHRLVLANGTSFVSSLTTNVGIGSLAASYTAAPPTVWQPSQTQTFNVTVTNTGTSPWRTTGSNPTRLGVYFQGNSDAIGDWTVAPQLVPLTADVLPGQSLTVSVSTTAPATSGNYVLRLRMNTENASWFTQLAKTNILVGTKAATYSLPTPSTADWWTAEARTTSITVTNTGTLTWNATGTDVTRLGYYFVPTSQVGLPAVTLGTFVPLPNNVSPGQAVTITVPVTAPVTAGSYRLEFRLENGSEWFTAGSVNSANVAGLTAVYSGAVPTEWPSTAVKTYSLTLTNNSTRTWLATGTERVQLQATFSGQTPVLFALPSNVAPGATVTVSLTMAAPAAAGSSTLLHRLVLANGRTFTSSLSTTITIGSLAATYTATPQTFWLPGQTRTFNVTVTNTGTSPWRMSGANPTQLGVYFQGRSDTIGDWVVAPQVVSLASDVLPGQTATIAVTTTAPTTAGTYVLRLRMVTVNAAWFAALHKTNVDVGTLNATYTSTPPATWITGQTQTFTATIVNTGTGVWRAGGTNFVRLGVYFNGTSDTIGAWPTEPQRISLPNDVLPGQSVTLTVTATAPTTAGTYTLRMRMVAEGTSWFTPLHKTTVAVQTLAATYTSTVPTAWTRNQLRTFSITLTNTGTATWNNSGTNPVRLAYYFFGNSDNANDWSVEPTRISLPSNVAPGQSITFNISVRAPATAGTFTLRLRLVKESVAWFSTLKKTTVTVT